MPSQIKERPPFAPYKARSRHVPSELGHELMIVWLVVAALWTAKFGFDLYRADSVLGDLVNQYGPLSEAGSFELAKARLQFSSANSDSSWLYLPMLKVMAWPVYVSAVAFSVPLVRARRVRTLSMVGLVVATQVVLFVVFSQTLETVSWLTD